MRIKTQPLTTPDNEPVSQPSGCQFGKTDKLCNIDCECVLESQPYAEPGQEITPEALEAETRKPESLWQISSSYMAYDYQAGNVVAVVTVVDKVNIYIQTEHTPREFVQAKGVSTMQDLNDLCRLVNGVAIPS